MKEREQVVAFTDGSCFAKHPERLGGSGVYILYKNKEYTISKGYKYTTIGRRESEAILLLLKAIKKNIRCTLTIYIDSQYVITMLTTKFVDWQFGILNCQNQDIWNQIFKEIDEHKKLRLKCLWTKGHQKNKDDFIVFGNHVADCLANYKNHKNYKQDQNK